MKQRTQGRREKLKRKQKLGKRRSVYMREKIIISKEIKGAFLPLDFEKKGEKN